MLNRERRDRKNEKDECQNERDPKYTFRSNQIQRFQTIKERQDLEPNQTNIKRCHFHSTRKLIFSRLYIGYDMHKNNLCEIPTLLPCLLNRVFAKQSDLFRKY